jgi:hypothetical protein
MSNIDSRNVEDRFLKNVYVADYSNHSWNTYDNIRVLYIGISRRITYYLCEYIHDNLPWQKVW